jgi:hypothetical protein
MIRVKVGAGEEGGAYAYEHDGETPEFGVQVCSCDCMCVCVCVCHGMRKDGRIRMDTMGKKMCDFCVQVYTCDFVHGYMHTYRHTHTRTQVSHLSGPLHEHTSSWNS